MRKLNFIDLFSGCGGLSDGFLQSGFYNHIASVEWEKAPVNTSRKRLSSRWNIQDSDESVIRFDIQRTDELLNGFDDEVYGKHCGLIKLIGKRKIDVIIGGPPCQAYSVAGRVSVHQEEKPDYRNYLFEYYLKVVERLEPKVFLFENVPGMLSAMPDGTPIIDLIKRDIESKGFEIINNIGSNAIVNAVDYGVPQNRRRVILVGLNKKYFKNNRQDILLRFYNQLLCDLKINHIYTVEEAIGDLPPCLPLYSDRRPSHTIPVCDCSWHYSRYHSLRDVNIFRMLAEDIETQTFNYTDSERLKDIYNDATGSNTNVHKYHVLRRDEPSTTILAHLYKDGLRFIHYDSRQARTITVREAARLQSFDDDFDFVGTQGAAFKMIGNAVPPKLAKALSIALFNLLMENSKEEE
jgi:DNA (cytosine-5)-methyltransferase 1